MREVIFDTETTGLKHQEGHRIIEIGAVELINRFPTGRTFHEYINPEDMAVDQGAFEVHGISNEQLKDKPLFRDILPGFLQFFAEGNLIAHNAPFDVGFINAELKRVGERPLDQSRIIDTLAIARRKYPGAKNNLDALCNRFGISNAHRTLHGALLDSEILADVYIELTGGKQVGLSLDDSDQATTGGQDPADQANREPQRQRANPLPSFITKDEQEAHLKMIEEIGDNAIWNKWKN